MNGSEIQCNADSKIFCLGLINLLCILNAAAESGESVRLAASADIGISSQVYEGVDERLKSWGLSKRFKLKSIQEMGVIRFDPTPVLGREVRSSRLFLHCDGSERLRYLRISTVNQNWEEGQQSKDYGSPMGACFRYADFESKREWAWSGSELSDVVLGAGHSRHHWAECKKLDGGWLSVDLPPDLIYALAVGDSDGLCIQEGGDLAYHNNFIHSVQSGRATAPYIMAQLGGKLEDVPAKPEVRVLPAGEHARHDRGVVKLSISPDPQVFCWRLMLNGQPVPRWQVAHPSASGQTKVCLEDLPPGQACVLEIVAVSRSGRASASVSLTAQASAALPIAPLLEIAGPPAGDAQELSSGGKLKLWACSGLVKVDPVSGEPLFGDAKVRGQANAVWDGKRVALFGMRGEFVSFQMIVEKTVEGAQAGISVTHSALKGPGGALIPETAFEPFRNWYARNGDKRWQPAYCVPLKPGEAFTIPDPLRGLEGQRNQSLYFDVLIPKVAKPGRYSGAVKVEVEGDSALVLPVELEVLDLVMPDKLAIWPQLNCYRMPKGAVSKDVYRLAHKHRNVFFQRDFKPALQGKGKEIQVVWEAYDQAVGPLLSGEAFKDLPRASVPIEALPLPFIDSWPTELTPETYRYKGDWTRTAAKEEATLKKLTEEVINPHYATAPYIGEAFSAEYLDAFRSVQFQFIEHFKEKGWNQTEMQCLFMGKNTHRIRYNVNMWWTTDEPYHWDDWLALQFFGKLWCDSRGAEHARQWPFRSDISRPQWQARTLDGVCDVIHFGTGAFNSPAALRRCQELCREGPFSFRVYGGANRDNASNHGSVVWILNAWLSGATAALPWVAMGSDASLDTQDGGSGYALIAPGTRLGTGPLADLRLKAFRDAEQFVQYLLLFEKKHALTREQVKYIVRAAIPIETRVEAGAAADNADALRFETLQDWHLAGLRQKLAESLLSH